MPERNKSRSGVSREQEKRVKGEFGKSQVGPFPAICLHRALLLPKGFPAALAVLGILESKAKLQGPLEAAHPQHFAGS